MTDARETATDGRLAVVCGAGIAGLTAAWWLDRDGWDVLLVEWASGLRDEGYLIDFFGAGFDVAERMGLLPDLSAVAYDVDEVVNVNGQGKRRSAFDYDLFTRLLDGRLVSVMRGDLERVLFEALPESVDLRYGCTVETVDPAADRVRVALSDGHEVDAALLVGADGVHSRVRDLVFGPEDRFLRDLGYRTGAYRFEDASVRERLDGEFELLTVPNRTAGFYPLREGQIGTWFAYRVDDSAERPGDVDDPCTALARAFGDLDWVVPDALGHCGEGGVYFDQVAQVELDEWARGRVTLVGDAAGAVSLLAGQGSSVAMTTAYVLARELRGSDAVESALAAYEQTMLPDVTSKQVSGRRTANFFLPPTRAHLAARNLALTLSRLPGLGRILAPVVSAADAVPGEA